MEQQNKPLGPQAKVGIIAELVRNARLIWRLLKDNRVSPWVKAVIPATIVYLLSPVDLVPDALLGLGQLDDLAIILLGVKFFLDLCPPHIVKEHLAELMSLDASYRIVHEDRPVGPSREMEYLEGKYRVVDNTSPSQENKPPPT
mgnify:CR=1 FL=1